MNDDKPDDKLDEQRTVSQPVELTQGPAVAPAPAPLLPTRQDSGNALPIGTFLDEFELRSVAGEGGFSIVYRGWDHTLRRQVAVKEYFPSGMVGRSGGTQVVVRSERHTDAFEAGLKAFVKEAQLLAQFDHPALIKVYRFWKANGSAYMVMPFCEGITLRDDWRAKPEPPDEMALMTLLDPLTDALGVLHAERWYHRDIAPDNVMLLAGTRRPLLLDFGAARQVIGDMTHALTVILKPGYAPIEQWGEVPGMQQGPWTDVYALGAMIHFGIMRRTPPPSVGRLVNDGYEPLVQAAAGRYSERFLAAVDHALAVRPEHRIQSIEQFRDEIGLNEFHRDRTQTWMPGLTLRPAVLDVELATAAPAPAGAPPVPANGSAHGPALASELGSVEFTQRPDWTPGPDQVVIRDDSEVRTQPLAPPAASARSPVLLFGAGLVVTALLGIGAYQIFKPAPAPVRSAEVKPTATATTTTPPVTPVDSASAAASMPSAAPVAPGPAAPLASPRFDAVKDFERVVAAQAPGRAIEVTLVRTTLRSEKDDISFTVKSPQDGYLYVFNHGSDGSLLQLYPNKAEGLPRLKRDVALNLPRSSAVKFTISGPSGTNQLLVMVSSLQRDHSAFSPRDEGGFLFYPTGSSANTLSARHKGPLPWVAGVPKCPAQGACNDEFGAAVATFNVVQ